MSLHQLDPYPSCDWCRGMDRWVIESRIALADLHESCVDGYLRATAPEDYCPLCGAAYRDCNCPTEDA